MSFSMQLGVCWTKVMVSTFCGWGCWPQMPSAYMGVRLVWNECNKALCNTVEILAVGMHLWNTSYFSFDQWNMSSYLLMNCLAKIEANLKSVSPLMYLSVVTTTLPPRPISRYREDFMKDVIYGGVTSGAFHSWLNLKKVLAVWVSISCTSRLISMYSLRKYVINVERICVKFPQIPAIITAHSLQNAH